MKKSTYINSIHSREKIQQAVLNAIKNVKNIDEITITDIVKQANINRGTFYNHYNSIKEVIEEIENNYLESLYQTLSFDPSDDFITQSNIFFAEIIHFFRLKNDELTKIASSFPTSIFDNFIDKFFAPYLDAAKIKEAHTTNDYEKNTIYRNALIISSCVNSLIKKKYTEQLDISYDKILILIRSFIKILFDNSILE